MVSIADEETYEQEDLQTENTDKDWKTTHDKGKDTQQKTSTKKIKNTRKKAAAKKNVTKAKAKRKLKIKLPSVSDTNDKNNSRPESNVSCYETDNGQTNERSGSDMNEKADQNDTINDNTDTSKDTNSENLCREQSANEIMDDNQEVCGTCNDGFNELEQQTLTPANENEINVTEECKTDADKNDSEDKSLDGDGDTQEETKTDRLNSKPQTKEAVNKRKKITKAKVKAKAASKDNKSENNTSKKCKGDTENKKTVGNKSTKDLKTSLEESDSEADSVKDSSDNVNSERKRPKTADVGTQCGRQTNQKDDDVYSPDEDCIKLHEAIYGKKTDKDTVNKLLTTRSTTQRLEMVHAYKMRYDKDVLQDIRSTFRGDYKDLCTALLQDQATQDAELLNYSVKGLGTNEMALIHILASRSAQEITRIRDRYLELYGHPAEDDVRGDTSGPFQTLCLVQLGKSGDDSEQRDERTVEEDARRLWRPGERPTQDHEDALIEILTSINKEQFASVCHIYQKITDITFKEAVIKSTRGDFRDALLTMVSCLEDRANYHAETLHKSLKGFRSNDRVVINIVISRMEIDLTEINEDFQNNYGKTLYHAIKSNYSGDFAKLILQLVENHVTEEF